MKILITVEREDDDGPGENSTSMGISASGVQSEDVFSLLLAGAEMLVYDHVHAELIRNGASELEAEFGAPMRTRLLTLEKVVTQDMTPYRWVHLDLQP